MPFFLVFLLTACGVAPTLTHEALNPPTTTTLSNISVHHTKRTPSEPEDWKTLNEAVSPKPKSAQ